MQCTATSKRTRQPCQRPAMIGGHLCYHHGGKTPAGIASATYKTGRYSKVLPARLLDRYHAAAADPDLLRLDAEIALIDARLAEVLAGLDTEDTTARWEALRTAWGDVQRALQGQDHLALLGRLRAVDALLMRPYPDYAAWADVQELVQARRRLVESERKHLVEQQQMIRLDQVMAVLTAMALSVKEHVTDPATLRAISAEYARLTTGIGGTVTVVDADVYSGG